jgi:hypothetical protein
MYDIKNIVVMGVVSLMLLGVVLYVESDLYIDSQRNDPAKAILLEPQECQDDAGCTAFYAYCGNNKMLAISIESTERYQKMFQQHCAENPPQEILEFSGVGTDVKCGDKKCSAEY